MELREKYGLEMSRRKLSQLYKLAGVKKKVLRKPDPRKISRPHSEQLELLVLREKVESYLKRNYLFVFVDEATFSPKSY